MLKEITGQQYGTSVSFCDYIIKNQIAQIKPKDIVDFGAGGGKIGKISREVLDYQVNLIAVEGHQKTADMLSEQSIYNRVYHSLIQDWINTNADSYDLAVFGDVLEHLTPKEIHKVIKQCLAQFKHIIVICPINELFQGAVHENDLEIHRTYMTPGVFDRYHPVEKHIVRGSFWTIMNVLILSDQKAEHWKRKVFWYVFPKCMYVLQPVGLARPFVSLLESTIFKHKNIYRTIGTKR